MTVSATVQFLGAAETVTGSQHLVRANDRQILLDCGLFQGLKELRLRNWRQPPFDARMLDAVVLSHAHIDHCGGLPLLAKHGFRGPLHCSAATADLLPIMLRDAARLQEEDAEAANRYGYSKHQPALPLYTTEDAEAILRLIQPHPYDHAFEVARDNQVILRRTGHILGASSVELDLGGTTKPIRLIFTGDMGRFNRPILRDPEFVKVGDVLLTEATYGNRNHPSDPLSTLARIVRESAERGGALIIPAFAVGRSQEVVWMLRKLEDTKQIPIMPVYVDSPMAINVSEVYARHPEDHHLDAQALLDPKRSPLCTHYFHLSCSRDQSKAINHVHGPLIVISANGMATGGRVLHHLKLRLPDARSTILLVGFQSEGTRGRALEEGARSVKIHGQDVAIHAKVEKLDGLSAHADRDELLRWLSGFSVPPRHTYIVHSEVDSAQSLADTLNSRSWTAEVARDLETVDLTR
jgi:metallo-beta-lactamase family protein